MALHNLTKGTSCVRSLLIKVKFILTQNTINLPQNNYWIYCCLFLGPVNGHYFLWKKASIVPWKVLNFDNFLIWHACDCLIKSVICMTNIKSNILGVTFFSTSWIFFFLLPLCRYSTRSNKFSLIVWVLAVQSTWSIMHFLLQWRFSMLNSSNFLNSWHSLHNPAIHDILSELHSALLNKSALSVISFYWVTANCSELSGMIRACTRQSFSVLFESNMFWSLHSKFLQLTLIPGCSVTNSL